MGRRPTLGGQRRALRPPSQAEDVPHRTHV